MPNTFLQITEKGTLSKYLSYREGEKKLVEKIQVLNSNEDLHSALTKNYARFVLLGIPEDIGIRANHGKGGSSGMWESFLGRFLNIQSNTFNSGEEVLILGEINCSDLIQQSFTSNVDELRKLTTEIDLRVFSVVSVILASGKIPIVIGGGHNNSYPLLQASSEQIKNTIDCINIDAHADLRKLEGRHSGNGFSYALHEKYLERYFVLGLHENYNSEYILQQFEHNEQFHYLTFDSILKNKIGVHECISKALQDMRQGRWVLEVDLDSIAGFPSSAASHSGWTVNQMRTFMMSFSSFAPLYVHFCEGIPDTENQSAKTLAYLVSDFIKNYGEAL